MAAKHLLPVSWSSVRPAHLENPFGPLQWMVRSRVINDMQEACWEMVSAMASEIIQLLDSDNDGIRTHAIKFVEALIITLSPRMPDSEVPRRHESDISLDRVPKDHPYIKYSECALRRGWEVGAVLLLNEPGGGGLATFPSPKAKASSSETKSVGRRVVRATALPLGLASITSQNWCLPGRCPRRNR